VKVLLDECLPRPLKNCFPEHECRTVPEAGLAVEKNGRLLALAERAGFEVFLTMDKGLQYQRDMAGRNIAVVIIRSKSNRLADLLTHVLECREIMGFVQVGQVAHVGD
jgi:hypothetical protein